jgi:hypothetical protein
MFLIDHERRHCLLIKPIAHVLTQAILQIQQGIGFDGWFVVITTV